MLIANVHREVQAPATMPDVELEYWARVYLQLNLLHEGVTFEDFLLATPQVRESAERRALLLIEQLRRQKQRAVQSKVDATAGLRYALAPEDHRELRKLMTGYSARGNGQRIEKLRHKRWPRRRNLFVRDAE